MKQKKRLNYGGEQMTEKRNFKAGVLFFFFSLFALLWVNGSIVFAKGASTTEQIIKYYQQMEEGGMFNHKLANELNSEAVKNPTDPHDLYCLFCHTSQGFIQWSGNGFAVPTRDKPPKYSSPVEDGMALGLACTTCHKSKKASKYDDSQLRINAKPTLLTSGFKVSKEDAGNGAVCMTCHNSNRFVAFGTTFNDKNFPKFVNFAPHETTQTDMLMGRNFFFNKTGKQSVHMDVDGTCVGCHMDKGDSEISNHTFEASFDNCSSCYDDDISGKKVKKDYMEKFSELEEALSSAAKSFAQAGLDAGNLRLKKLYDDESEDTRPTKFARGKVTDVKFQYFHGRQAVRLKINNKPLFTFVDSLKSQGAYLLDTIQGQMIVKAGWNFIMLEHDRSHGAHAPNLSREIIQSTLKHLNKTDFTKITKL